MGEESWRERPRLRAIEAFRALFSGRSHHDSRCRRVGECGRV